MIDGIPKKSLSSISNRDIVFEEQEDNPEVKIYFIVIN